jgi:uncharacterized repeat protein (TIGR03803 family)
MKLSTVQSFGCTATLAAGLCFFCSAARADSGSFSAVLKNMPDNVFSTDSVVVGANGNIFLSASTIQGDVVNGGEVLQISPAGAIVSTAALNNVPAGSISNARNGDIFAMTQTTVFEISPSGTATPVISSVHSTLDGFDGAIAEASDGTLYGVADEGGDNGDGGVFKIDTSGNMTTLHSFAADDSARAGRIHHLRQRRQSLRNHAR